MKLCNAEVIKKIKDLEEQKQEILSDEQKNCTTTYQTETDMIDTGYDFEKTRTAVENLNKEIMRLKHALNISNSTVIVQEFGLTIGECLVYMAQLNNEKFVLEKLSRNRSKSRTTLYNGTVEYTDTNYDVEVCKDKLNSIKETIRQLQLSIDRVNLNNMIEI
ncbi:MAG: hypothetical protein FWD23_03150 [Oscillospiraceae bacterium]|nr:hypothetical protein [Oscillospiraceae bacterium]